MKKSLRLIALVFVVLTLASCSTLASLVGMDGLAGFDSQSKKALEQGFIEIDWLNNEELKETVSMLCANGNFSVSYSDRHRMLEFVAFNSSIRLHVYNDRIEFVYIDNLPYESIIYGDGWADPRRIELECYGQKMTESLNYGDVVTTNESSYDKILAKTVQLRYQDVTHVMSEEAANFLNKNWNNNDLYMLVDGSKDITYRIKNNDLVNLYRTLYEALFPYEFLSGAADGAIADFINGLTTVNSYQASAINYYISNNESLTRDQIRSLSNLVNSKIR